MSRSDRILAVDDNPDNLMILDEILGDSYTIRCVESGEDALRVAPQFQPNLVLLDLMMPGLDGQETCRQLVAQPELKDAKIIMLSAKSDLKNRLAAYDVGVVDYVAKPFDHEEIRAKVRAWMQMVYKQQVEEIWREAERAREVVGYAMVTLAGFRDTETGDHLFRMRWYCNVLAEHLSIVGPYREQIDEAFLQQLYRASPLHDIGKVAIDDALLRKPSPLTDEEFEVMKRHTIIGADILARAVVSLPDAEYMKMAAQIARSHHERHDGLGYPDGLAGCEIPLAARIVSVADVFDALTSDRIYRGALPVSDAWQMIVERAGTYFDPIVVESLTARLDDFRQSHSRFAEECARPVGLIGAAANSRLADRSVDHVENCLHGSKAALAC